MENQIVFEPLPGGFTWILAGGTRTTIKLNRPWQMPLEKLLNPAKCPFCTKPQEKIALDGIPDGWWFLPNPITPHTNHRLAVPDQCWSAEKLALLGGEVEIAKALETARLAIQNDNMEAAIFCHIGWLAGQNLGHNHWHICDAQVQQSLNFLSLTNRPERFIARNNGFEFRAEGSRAGQVLILPEIPERFSTDSSFDTSVRFAWKIEPLARALAWLVGLCNDKFRSTDQGLPPEYAVTVRISPDQQFLYACYCPYLNATSPALHDTVAALEGGPHVLPWTHEVTAEYLRS